LWLFGKAIKTKHIYYLQKTKTYYSFIKTQNKNKI